MRWRPSFKWGFSDVDYVYCRFSSRAACNDLDDVINRSGTVANMDQQISSCRGRNPERCNLPQRNAVLRRRRSGIRFRARIYHRQFR